MFNCRFSQPIHFLFFHVAKYSNVDLYKHCKTTYLVSHKDIYILGVQNHKQSLWIEKV